MCRIAHASTPLSLYADTAFFGTAGKGENCVANPLAAKKADEENPIGIVYISLFRFFCIRLSRKQTHFTLSFIFGCGYT